MNNNKIDFVILWVDGSDPKWLSDKNKYSTDKVDISNQANRYRDWGLLKYWFRGVEKNASWVNNIYFVTYGHLPSWLNLDNPKLKIVKHEDFIPKEYLPTFNSNVIQYYLNRIEGLSDNFVLFDDDIYILDKVKETDFFKDGKIRDIYGEKPFWISKPGDKYPHSILNNLQYLNSHYNKRKVYMKNIFKYFNFRYSFSTNIRTLLMVPFNQINGIYHQHICMSYTKENYDIFWKYCKDDIEKASNNKFRSYNDLTTLMIKEIALLEGNFIPRKENFGKRLEIGQDSINKIVNVIENKKYKVLCLNDSIMDMNFDEIRDRLLNVFESIFPDKSSFEK